MVSACLPICHMETNHKNGVPWFPFGLGIVDRNSVRKTYCKNVVCANRLEVHMPANQCSHIRHDALSMSNHGSQGTEYAMNKMFDWGNTCTCNFEFPSDNLIGSSPWFQIQFDITNPRWSGQWNSELKQYRQPLIIDFLQWEHEDWRMSGTYQYRVNDEVDGMCVLLGHHSYPTRGTLY